MADRIPEFESADKKGSTDVYTGSVTTSWTAIPSSPGGDIQSFTVISHEENLISEYIEVSLNGGTTVYDRIYPSGFVSDLIKGLGQTQIYIRGQSAAVDYKVILDREPV